MSEHAVSAELLHDPAAYATTLKRVHEAVLSGAPVPLTPRSVISRSWDRSLAAHVDPDSMLPPVVYQRPELDDVRETHPLAPVLPVLRQSLVGIADEAEHIMIVTDAEGLVLWREGEAKQCHRADRVLLTEGARWSEAVIGTNAMGTVLATGEAVQVYSAEHLVRTYHGWTCSAAPIRDPESGTLLGAVDVSGPLHTAHPAMLALVTATAGLAEGQLRAHLAVRDERLRRKQMPHLEALRGEAGALLSPSGRVLAAESCGQLPDAVDVRTSTVSLPDGRIGALEGLPEGYLLRLGRGPRAVVASQARSTLSLEFLVDGPPVAAIDGREVPLTLRRAELLAALAMRPAGMSAEQLALQIYGEEGNPVTVRAEIHRLRAQLGTDVLRTKPYRIAATIDADFLRARAAMRDGDVAGLFEVFRAPLLPDSEAPGIREERDSLTALARRMALDSRDPETLWAYWETPCGADDLEVVETLSGVMAPADARTRIIDAHHERLLETWS